MPYYFVPPSVTIRWPMDGALTYPQDHGLTVLITGGVATQKQYATHAEREAADYCYVGGRQYELSDAEKTLLEGLGYGDEIFFLSGVVGEVSAEFNSDAGSATAEGGVSDFIAVVNATFTSTVGEATAAGEVGSLTGGGLFTYDPQPEFAGAYAYADGGVGQMTGPSFVNGTFSTVEGVAQGAGGVSSFVGSVAIVLSVNSANAGTTAVGTQSYDIPAGVTTGDIGMIVCTAGTGEVPTANPTGWTYVGAESVNTYYTMYTWTKDLTEADASTTVSWTPFTGGRRFAGQLLVVSGSSGVDVSSAWTTTVSGTGYTLPSLTPLVADTIAVAFQASRAAVAGANSATPPAGWTELADTSMSATVSPTFQQSVLSRDTDPTLGVATGNTTGGVVATAAAQRSALVYTFARDNAPVVTPWTMYFGSSAQTSAPEPFEDGTGTYYTGKGLGGLILPVYRKYFQATDAPSAFGTRVAADHAAGRLPFMSTKLPGTWQAVAAGTYDSWLQDRIDAIVAAATPGYDVHLALHHEPRSEVNGTTHQESDWIAMHNRAKQLKDATVGAESINIVGILNGYSFDAAGGSEIAAWQSTPADGDFDLYGYDNYNPWFNGVGTLAYRPVATWIQPANTLDAWGWAEKMVIGEYGVREYTTAGVSAQWMADAYQACLDYKFHTISFFNSGANSPDGTWILDGERLTEFITELGLSTTRRVTD